MPTVVSRAHIPVADDRGRHALRKSANTSNPAACAQVYAQHSFGRLFWPGFPAQIGAR
jgi:hypothetical protein